MKRKTMMDIVEELGVSTEQKKAYCTNRDLDGRRWCLCTSNETCEGCDAFMTNMLGQANIIVEAFERMQEENKAMDEAFRTMAGAVSVVSCSVESLYSMARELRDYYKDDDKTVIPSENKRLCKDIIAEARKIVRAGGNAKFTTTGDMKK